MKIAKSSRSLNMDAIYAFSDEISKVATIDTIPYIELLEKVSVN